MLALDAVEVVRALHETRRRDQLRASVRGGNLNHGNKPPLLCVLCISFDNNLRRAKGKKYNE